MANRMNGSAMFTSYEGTLAEDGKTWTYTCTGPDMKGGMQTSTMVVVMDDDNHRSWRSWEGTDTSKPPMMEMTYERAGKMTTAASDMKHKH